MLKIVILFCLFLFSSVASAVMSTVDREGFYRDSLKFSTKTGVEDYNRYKIIENAFTQLFDEVGSKVFVAPYDYIRVLQNDVFVDKGTKDEKHFNVDYFNYLNLDTYLNLLLVGHYYGTNSLEFGEYLNYFILKTKNSFIFSRRMEGVDSTRAFLVIQPKPIVVGSTFDMNIELYTKNNANYDVCAMYDKLGVKTCNSVIKTLDPINSAYALYAYKKLETSTGNIFGHYKFKDIYHLETGDIEKISIVDMSRLKMLVKVLFPNDTTGLRLFLINEYVFNKHRYDLRSYNGGVGEKAFKNGYWETVITK